MIIFSICSWKSSISQKCKFFIWSILHKRITTPQKYYQRRLLNMSINPNWCLLCKQKVEKIWNIVMLPTIDGIWIKLQILMGTVPWVKSNVQELCKNICCLKMNSRKKHHFSTQQMLYYDLSGTREISISSMTTSMVSQSYRMVVIQVKTF